MGDGGGFIGLDSPASHPCCLRGLQRVDGLGGRVKEGGREYVPGTGSELMQRIAAPMVGGMLTAPLLSMFVVPVAFLLMRRSKTQEISDGSTR
ncbi:hypothetical protein EWH46_04095 [Sphaerotilus sulfidivorans]|uniref:Efflux RND transporter permease subunit n=1 Tax=Sphaerotilus sulfidivorans TaxID=639200 RepID=A0A5C1PZA1_9BURK|nr:hypothetical protein EWH46_04095 [Sphaerotilus sulfidivorans]